MLKMVWAKSKQTNKHEWTQEVCLVRLAYSQKVYFTDLRLS